MQFWSLATGIIRQILLNDSAKVNLMMVLQQILLDENLKFLRV